MMSFFIISCESTVDNESQIENYTDSAITDLQERSGCGFGGCFELVFPVTIIFADESTATSNSLEEMKAAIKTWVQANPDTRPMPKFQFPIDVIKDDGTIASIADAEAMMLLRKECPRKFGKGHGKGNHCFRLEIPFTLLLADGSSIEVNSKDDLPRPEKGSGRPDPADRPKLVFPVDVKLKDGTSQTINSKEELIALKDSCR